VAQRKGIDGGMNALFAAKTPNGSTGHSEERSHNPLVASSAVPPVPPSVNPPASPETSVAFAATSTNYGGDYMSSPASPAAATASRAEPAKQPSANSPVRVASASSSGSEGFFSSLARKIGIGGGSDTTATTTPAPAKQAASAPKAKPVVAAIKPPAAVKSSEPKVAAKPQPASAEPKERDTAMAGASPVMPSNGFESRWSLR
jgi:hypothetical protein